MNQPSRLTEETFQSLRTLRAAPPHALDWPTVFVTPSWLESWWRAFGADDDLMLTGVRDGDDLLGIAPLRVNDGLAQFVGSPDICDYLDCIVRPDAAADFYATLMAELLQNGVRALELHSLRPESTVMTDLVPLAQQRGLSVSVTEEDASMELDFFSSWDDYIAALDKKQRGELRRKMRNLDRAGTLKYQSYTAPADISRLMDVFLSMFRESREDKADFMTAGMDGFFRAVVAALAADGVARFGALYLDDMPVAMVLCFDHGDRLNLYNSGYDPSCRDLSAGLVCKAYCIEETIGRGMRYDFLRGREVYKSRLGAREVPIRSVRIEVAS